MRGSVGVSCSMSQDWVGGFFRVEQRVALSNVGVIINKGCRVKGAANWWVVRTPFSVSNFGIIKLS